MTQINLLRQVKNLNFPEWFLINWQIVTSVSSWNLTVAIKTLAWTDPSVTDPVYCRVDWVVRTITSALSDTYPAWTNWRNAWSPELAWKEIDYFVYIWVDNLNNIRIWVSRLPSWNNQNDFSASGTYWNERYLMDYSTSFNVVNIWRFNAILSAWPSYTFSIPATSVIINRPIYSTRFLDYSPQWTWYTAWWAKYKIDNESLYLIIDSTANITWNITTPFTCSNTVDNQMNTDIWTAVLSKNSNTITVASNPQNINWFYWI